MEQFDGLRQRAQTAGCETDILALEQQCEELVALEDLQVVILGGSNSGKTTLLNALTGAQVRQPSLISQSEKPLRVVFRRMPERSGFDHVTLFSKEWMDTGAELHEASLDDAIDAQTRRPSGLMNLVDVVIYVVSAVMPLTDTDTKVLRSLKEFPTIVVLNKLPLLQESDREAVENFVRSYCAANGIAEVVAMSDDSQGISRTLRSLLSRYSVSERREEHIRQIVRQGNELIRARLALRLERIAADRATLQADISRRMMDTERARNEWHSIRLDMRDRGAALTGEIARIIEATGDQVFPRIMETAEKEKFSSTWSKSMLEPQMAQLLEETFDSARQQVETRARYDVLALCDRIRGQFGKTIEIPPYAMEALTQVAVRHQSPVSYYKSKGAGPKIARDVFLGALAVTGFMLPLPFIALPVLSVGGVIYLHQKDKFEYLKREYEGVLRQCWMTNLRNLIDSVSISIREHYDDISDLLNRHADSLTVDTTSDTRELDAREALLREELSKCDALKEA